MKTNFLFTSIIFLIVCAPASRAVTFCTAPVTPECMYETPVSYPITTNKIKSVSYTDYTGAIRTFEVDIRIPNGAPEPFPIVIWSHGGATGKSDATQSLPEWSDVSASAGYLTISIAHPARGTGGGPGSRESLCSALGFVDINGNIDVAICDNFKHLNWDRPFDILQVLLALQNKSLLPNYQGRLDLTSIALGGHSSGSSGVLTAAGAVRNLMGHHFNFLQEIIDQNLAPNGYPHPVAVMAFSPQGAGTEGFYETDFQRFDTSWDALDLPVLLATGAGDNGCNPIYACVDDSTPSVRRAVFDLLPASGGKYRMYLASAETFHTLFEYKNNHCGASNPVTQSTCDEFKQWLKSATLAFLDAKLRGWGDADSWLNSDNLVNGADLSQPGVATWDVK